jgi:peptidoglycan/xylan/chitin deacetylase (PgdA/CDA1 family)
MLKTVFRLASLAIFSATAAELRTPQPEICKFKSGRQAAVSLTFDDASKDHLTQAMPLLEKYGFKGTFYVIVKRVPASENDSKLTWNELKQMAEHGHEIGNHSMTHYQLTKAKDRQALEYEIVTPIAIIEKEVGVKPITFCYPGNARNQEIIELTESVHVGSTARGRYFYGSDAFDLQKQAAWLDQAIAQGKAHIAMVHGIVPGGGGWKPFESATVFEQALQNIKQREKDLWVCRYDELCQYEKLRDCARLEAKPDGFLIKATRQFGSALTVRLSPCPEGLTARQNGKPLALVRRDGIGYLEVIPEHGAVKLVDASNATF